MSSVRADSKSKAVIREEIDHAGRRLQAAGRKQRLPRPCLWSVRPLSPPAQGGTVLSGAGVAGREAPAMWDALGISRGVIAHALGAGENNKVTLDALRRHPDRLRGVALVKADISRPCARRTERCRLQGVRINMLKQDGKPVSSEGMKYEDLLALAPRLAERSWHAQLWIETGDLEELAPTLEKLPLTYVIDHMGRTMTDKGVDYAGFRGFCERLKTGRYWCKLSGADRNTRQGAPSLCRYGAVHEGAGGGQPGPAGVGQRLAACRPRDRNRSTHVRTCSASSSTACRTRRCGGRSSSTMPKRSTASDQAIVTRSSRR